MRFKLAAVLLPAVLLPAVLLPAVLLAGLPLAAQSLSVSGDVEHPLTLTAADLQAMPRTMISVTEHNREVKYEGVLLRSVLEKAGAPLGDHLKGQNMTAVVLVSGKDSYRVALAMAEVDTAFQDNRILIVDRVNGSALDGNQGPFRLVVPEDHKGGRWVRMLDRIEVRLLRDGS